MNENLINDPKAIENLFQSFRASKIEIFLRLDLKEFTAQIHRVSDVSITLFYKGNIPTDIEKIDLNTTRGDSIYFATCRVLNISPSEITISLPEELEKGTKRKYRRVNTKDDVFIKFNVISNTEGKFESEEQIKKLPQQFTNIYREMIKPIPDIKIILPLLAQELKKKAPIFDIKLYGGDEPESKRIHVLKHFKRNIFISNVRDSKSYLKDIHNIDAISFLPYITQLKENNNSDQMIKEELLQIMKEDIRTNTISYICSPIKLFDQVIGHVFLGLSEGSLVFRDHDISFVQTCSEIISEAIAKSKLHQLDTGDEPNVPVIDLSAGGLLMQFKDSFIIKHLNVNTKLRIELKIVNKIIKLIGKITRLTSDLDVAIIGVKFTEIRWSEQGEVDKYVNRRLEAEKMQKDILEKD
ncbi:MAG: PilZ domain-containing protein [Spirochaetota bacterium]|nr:PilZ domain-containing protein [Spirochaetota bacterium]